jgi:PAS domain S-box-containing protein
MAFNIQRADQNQDENGTESESATPSLVSPPTIPRSDQTVRRYLIAPVAVILACLVKVFVLDALIEQETPFLVFFAAVMISAWYGGLRPGLLATVLAAFAATFFFRERHDLFSQGVRIVTFTLEGGLISLLCGALHGARQHAEDIVAVARRHEKAFRETEASYQIVSETASDAILTIDDESVIRYANLAAGKIFGYEVHELIGQKLLMLMPERFQMQHRQGIERYMQTGERHIPWKAVELPGLHRSGREIMLELSFGEFKRDGRHFFTGIARDITDRKHAERRAAAQHAATRTLAEATILAEAAPRILQAIGENLGWEFGALWLVDKDAGELRCIKTWSASQIESDEFEAIVSQSTFKRGVGLPGRAWESGQPVWITDVTQDQNFPRAPFAEKRNLRAAFAFPIVFGGAPLGVIEFFNREPQPRDEELLEMMAIIGGQMGQFIERQRVEEERAELLLREQAAHAQAEATSRAKDEFLATLSHELRTPLTPIIGWTHMLRRSEIMTEENRMTGINAIDKNAHALARLINDLLDMSAILNNKMRIERERVSLSDVLHEALETVEQQAAAQNIKIEITLCEDMTVTGDRARLVQVFWNLLANAVKFSREAKAVRIVCETDAQDVLVHIEDEGHGIAPEFLPFIFDRFRQADGSSTRQHGGMGIGLALVKTFVEAHGGSVSAASEGEGHGSRFTVRLPRASRLLASSDETARRDDATPEEGESARAKNRRVLIIEDETDTLQMLQLIFERRGFEVRACGSSAEAIRAADAGERFDIIVTDLGLPEMNGYKLIEHLRSVPGFEYIPAVALTGFAAAKDVEETLASGFTSHLAKPIDPSALIARIEELLDSPIPRTSPAAAAAPSNGEEPR